MDEQKIITDKERMYNLIYEALETHILSIGELMEVFFAILLEQNQFLENDDTEPNQCN